MTTTFINQAWIAYSFELV